MSSSPIYRLDVSKWSVERIVFGIAGVFVILATLLALFVHPDFLWLTIFFGGMLLFFSLTGYCPMAMLVAKIIRKN